jgi:hypothetical protein
MACGSIGHHALNFEYQPSLYGLFRNEVERPTATVAYKNQCVARRWNSGETDGRGGARRHKSDQSNGLIAVFQLIVAAKLLPRN